MKILTLAASIFFLGVMATFGSINIARADENVAPRQFTLAALVRSPDSCVQRSGVTAAIPQGLVCPSARIGDSGGVKVAATCGSGQWCCKHNFSTGACTKCCSK